MSHFGLGYPENYAKCHEIAVYDYGAELVFIFANVILVRNDPGKFLPQKLRSVIHTPFGYKRKSKKSLPEIRRNTECPSEERTESWNVFFV